MSDASDTWITGRHVGAYLAGMLPQSVVTDAIKYERLLMQIRAVAGMDDDAVAAEVVRVRRESQRLTLLEAARVVCERASRGEWP